MATENPFQFGRELGADELVNRTEELKAIRQTVENAEKLFLIGPRRYGKTSIMKAAADVLEKENHIVLRYNAESFTDISQLVKTVIEDSAKRLRGRVEQVGEQIRKYFQSLRPEISFNVTQTEWKSSIGLQPTKSSEEIGLLIEALNGLEKLAQDLPAERKVALMIDEFQEVIEQGGETAEKQIRSAVQQHRRVGYIFAGSKTRMLMEMTTDATRPFYRLGMLIFVGELPRAEFRQFLLDNFGNGGFQVEGATGAKHETGGAADLILDLAEDVPYNAQMLAHACWTKLQDERKPGFKPMLTETLIRETLEQLVRQFDPFYTQIWTSLTTAQKKALTAVVTENGENLQSMRVAQATGISPSTMRRSLELMLAREIIRQEEKAGTIRFRFEDPFFNKWIKIFVVSSKAF